MFPNKVYYNGSVWEMGYNKYFGTGYCRLTSTLKRHPRGSWMDQKQMLKNLKRDLASVAVDPKPSDMIIDTIAYSDYILTIKKIKMSSTTKTISKSTKKRTYGSKWQPRETKSMTDKSKGTAHFKQIVVITEVGKNKKGKVIHTSETKHIPA